MGIVINDESQISTARRLKCDGIFNKYFIANLRWACDERILKIGEHLLRARRLIISRATCAGVMPTPHVRSNTCPIDRTAPFWWHWVTFKVTFKVSHRLQAFNYNFFTVVQQLTIVAQRDDFLVDCRHLRSHCLKLTWQNFQWPRRVARSLCNTYPVVSVYCDAVFLRSSLVMLLTSTRQRKLR